jgi:hypothetical protein
VQGWAFCFPTLAAQKRRVEGGAPGKNKINCTINDKINRKVDDTINRKINDPTSAKNGQIWGTRRGLRMKAHVKDRGKILARDRGADLEALEALGARLDQRTGGGSYREVLAASLLRIRDKRGRLVRLETNLAQREFESRCGAKNIELKAHMRWIVGNGNEGKIQELEYRIRKHEAALQRTAGIGVAIGILLTVLHIAIDSLRMVHH